ncbi:MAG: DNA polymerase III subunit gamma/tau [Pigmentiphaga sp.]|nr:DNA polymerase III subunit gamma/tau [Pigmentiphaga sp.]
MTYLVLARKWRPRSFDTLVGQDHVVRALSTALQTGRLHHAWLFTGTRGVGKTTLSRILAKALNCRQGITATPCGECEACVGIEADRYVDYLELDAASNRGVEDMTRLLDQAVYAPTAGRFKVYMIDEVHMLTGHAFNAMLKTLEEPPPHVKFILATTDPQKIPVTVLSRCLQFNLKQMPPAAVAGHLEHVLGAEGVPAEGGALRLLGQAARGSMRDALSLTDQAIAYSGGEITEAAVRDMLGVIDQSYLLRLLRALAASDAAAVLAVADELSSRGLSYTAALDDLAGLLAQVAMAQRVPGLPAEDHPQADDIRDLAAALPADAVSLFYSIALHSRAELALAPDEYAGFVMACLRMLAFMSEAGAGGETPPVAAPAAPRRIGPAAPAGPSRADSAALSRAEAPVSPGAAPASAMPAAAAPPAAPTNATEGVAAARAALAALRGGGRTPSSGAARGAAPPPVSAAAPTSGASAADSPPTDLAPAAPAPASTAVPAPTPAPVAATSTPAPAQAPAPARPEAAALAPAPAPVPAPPVPEASTVSAVRPQPASAGPTRPAALRGEPPAPPDDAFEEPPGWAMSDPPWDDEPAAAPPRTQRASPPDARSADAPHASAGSAPPIEAPAAMPERHAAPPTDDAAPPVAPAPPSVALRDFQAADWPALAAALPLRGIAAELARQTEWVAAEGAGIVLRVATRALAQGPTVDRLRQALADYFQAPVQLRFEVGQTGSGTAHAVAQSEREARQREAEAAIAADPFVQSLIEHFDGQILPGSIRPAHTPTTTESSP